jgi:hypothetical protein
MATATQLAIADLTNGTDIANFNWADRGVAPRAYMRGMAVAFARSYTRFKADRDAASETAMPNSGDDSKDVLAWFANDFAALGMDNSQQGVDVLRHVYVVLTGLGMRESSGQHCAGTNGSTDADTAEAGLFQVSRSSIGAHFLLQALFDQYKGSTDFLDIFSDGVVCDAASWKNQGAGTGAQFQALMKNCPAFACEYTALALRHDRQHWGPINKRKVELRSEADDLFKTVCRYVDDHAIAQV